MVVPGRFYGFLPSIAPAGGVSGGSRPPGWCLLRHSGTLMLSAPGCGSIPEGGADTARGLHPRTPACDCPGNAVDGWSGVVLNEKFRVVVPV